MSLSRKSDESHHHKAVNGSSAEAKIPEFHETAKIVNETLPSEIVPTNTSTPIVDKAEVPQLVVKKRGRKPRPKPPLEATTSTIDLTSSSEITIPSLINPAPPKLKVKRDKKEKKILTPAETVSLPPPLDLSSTSLNPPKVVKKGRPKKEKPPTPQVPESVQEKQEVIEVKPEVTVFSMSRKVELPLEQFRTSVPHLASTTEQPPKLPEESEVSALPVLAMSSSESLPQVNHISDLQNGSILNGDGATSSCSGHKNKKKKKRRHSNSPSSGDRASSTKKKKRKHKQKDLELNEVQDKFKMDRSPEQPPIKMKFSSINSSGKGQKWKLASADDLPSEDFKPSTFNDIYKLNEVKVRKII